MPKIEVNDHLLFTILGRRFAPEELADLLSLAKAEIDDWEEEEHLIKVELNDTNRPDLWSTFGLARQLRVWLEGEIPDYSFLAAPGPGAGTGERVVEVDERLSGIRPCIAAFLAEGRPVDEPLLKDLIQSQEKLCWNFGRKRSSIAMGVYRADLMRFPVRYRAADPDGTSFVPLEGTRELTLRQILTEHPKGVEFGWIVKDFPLFPYLEDAAGQPLSFPPVINSDRLGAVKVGDASHFVELTGTDMDTLLLACSIVACDMADAGYTIRQVRVAYPYDTPYGRTMDTPFYFQKPITLELSDARRLLGEALPAEEAERCVRRMGVPAAVSGDSLTVTPPPYRNDFLHSVDVIEEIMIGRGMASFEPVWPEDFTVGRLGGMEQFSRRVRDTMVGLGYQEMIYNYLGSRRDFTERMNLEGRDLIRIANPMTENYEVLRNSALPNLLASESVSAHAAFPHRIFEIGKVARREPRANYGARTLTTLAALVSDREAGFNDISSHLQALFYYLSRELVLEEVEDPRFVPGRAARILFDGVPAGLLGEVHPAVLANWGIQMPCAAAEVDLDAIAQAALLETEF